MAKDGVYDKLHKNSMLVMELYSKFFKVQALLDYTPIMGICGWLLQGYKENAEYLHNTL